LLTDDDVRRLLSLSSGKNLPCIVRGDALQDRFLPVSQQGQLFGSLPAIGVGGITQVVRLTQDAMDNEFEESDDEQEEDEGANVYCSMHADLKELSSVVQGQPDLTVELLRDWKEFKERHLRSAYARQGQRQSNKSSRFVSSNGISVELQHRIKSHRCGQHSTG
jgi:hypothetical protein